MDFSEESIKKIFNGLNAKQVEAVESVKGPVLVMAGAGSGKTRVLTCRIANLIATGVKPYSILAITFTNKAANEMKIRAQNMIGSAAKSVWLSTFHSFCAKILRIEANNLKPYTNNFVIYSVNDCKNVIREVILELKLDDKVFIDVNVLSQISMAKNMLADSKKYREVLNFNSEGSHVENNIANIYENYEKRMQELNAMDFDDLLMITFKLFNENREVLEKYQEKFKYILVDEYQDTNEAQYRIVKLLAAKYKNIFVVGDPDQSIYGWRGADFHNILNFKEDYPNAKEIILEQNYRSTQNILEAANFVIENNKIREPKELWTNNIIGEQITIINAESGYNEARKIVDEIKNLKRKGFKYKDIALLYRINSQSRLLEEAFLNAGIPYIIVGGFKFYDRMEIKNIIAYLRLIYNPQDEISLRRIINVPRRGIGSATLAKLQSFATSNGVSIFEIIADKFFLEQMPLTKNIKKNLIAFVNLILEFRNLKNEISLEELIRYVLDKSGYMDELKIMIREEDKARIDNLEEFINVAIEYTNQYPDEASLEGFLNHIALISDTDVISEQADCVSLMTIHSAKGLEFPIVFITGFEEGLLPHAKSILEPEQLEEERRACYVAITRAEKKLYITYADSRMSFAGNITHNEPSRFLNEIPKQFLQSSRQFRHSSPSFVPNNSIKINFAPNIISKNISKNNFEVNDRIEHGKWGYGTVIKIIEEEIYIEFDDESIGIKKLALRYAPIRKV